MEIFDNLNLIHEEAIISKIYCTLLHLIDELFNLGLKLSYQASNYYEVNPIIAASRNLCSKLFLYAFDKIFIEFISSNNSIIILRKYMI
jgi:hypothetical protein